MIQAQEQVGQVVLQLYMEIQLILHLSRLGKLVLKVFKVLEAFKVFKVSRANKAFMVDYLSNGYSVVTQSVVLTQAQTTLSLIIQILKMLH
ncbi:MAG: hypothetical protein EBY62_09485 [Cellvibrionales bacterium]|nr:hypothetical protein [Cellvibrionales bacterium]